MTDQKDIYYIELVLKGEMSAFNALVKRHKDMAFTIAVRISKNREDAEEIAQDAFIKAYNNLHLFKKEAKFSTWLFKIVYNTAISRFRKKNIDTYSYDELVKEPGSLNEDSWRLLHNKEREIIVKKAIDKLNEDESLMLTLFYLNENSIKEIEDITGYTNSNVKILLHRGRKNLLLVLKRLLNKEIIDIL